MTDEASEFLRDEMRGDCMAMIEHQEREIADLREQLAEKQELIDELDAQISEIQRDWRKRTHKQEEVGWMNMEDWEDYDRFMDEHGHEDCDQMLLRNSARERRDFLDEIAWLHSELHGAEMDAKKAREQGYHEGYLAGTMEAL